MARDNCRRRTDNASSMAPHFFKIILSSEPRLRLPKKFVKKYGHNLPSLVSLVAPTGPLWQVELTRSNGEVWLEKGFQQFKEYHSIGFGATEIEYPYAAPKLECENNAFDGSSPSREERGVDSDNSVEISKDIQNWQKSEKSKRKFENLVEKEVSTEVLTEENANRQEVGADVSIEILDCFPPRKTDTEIREVLSTKIKAPSNRPKNAAVNEGQRSARVKDSVNEGKKAAMVKFPLPDHRSKSIGNKSVRLKLAKADTKIECNASTGCHLQFPVLGRIAKERVIAYQRAQAFKSKNPFFISLLQPSYVSGRVMMCFTKVFAQKYLTDKKYCDVVLGVPDGRTWKVKCYIGNAGAKLFWKMFVQDNDLQVGDACVFERKNDTECSLDVHIFRTQLRMQKTPCTGRRVLPTER